jgi:inner membrane protein
VPSYRKHAIFALILTFPFFPNIFSLYLAVIASSFPDFDHPVQKKNISILFFAGLALTMGLYIIKLPYTVGLIMVSLAIIFYLSRHRGFTHSILGISILSTIITILVLSMYFFFDAWGLSNQAVLVIIVIFLGLLSWNKRVIILFLLLASLGVFLTPFPGLNLYNVMGAVFLGFLSHVILDLFTPTGVELFRPVSSKRFKKRFGLMLIGLWAMCASYYFLYVVF